MSDKTTNTFGHISTIGRFKTETGEQISFVIDSWGSGPFQITAVDGRSYRFEDSDQFGPYTITRAGGVASNQPGPQSSFWRAHWLWRKQGRRTESDGKTCLWHEPKPTIYTVKRGQILLVEEGEPWGKSICDGRRIFDECEP